MQTNCLFCKIVNKEIPASVIYEDGSTVAFLDIHPRAPGHSLVIPKAHAVKIGDLPDVLLAPIFGTVKRVANMLEKSLSPDGLTIGMNQGAGSGQEVGHLHVQILPRFSGDGGGSFQSIVNNPPKETREEIAEKIKSNR